MGSLGTVDIAESVWRRGWDDAKRGWTDWRFVIADMLALPLLAIFVSVPIAIGVAALSLIAVWVGATAGAPIRQRNEARRALAELKERDESVEVTAAYPTVHTEEGVAPLGDYILVPLTIVRHGDTPMDFDLDLEVTVTGEEPKYMLPLENSAIVNAPRSLPRSHRGSRQLTVPLRIAGESREVGFAAFSVDILPPDSLSNDFSEWKVERMVLSLYDGVNHVLVEQKEIWPSIWPEVFDMATQQNPKDA